MENSEELVKKDYKKGLAIAQISQKYGISGYNVYKIVKPLVKELGRSNRKLTPEDREEIRKKYSEKRGKESKLIQKLAAEYRVKPVTVFRLVSDIRRAILEGKLTLFKERLSILTEGEIGYLAGLIDGDGYIGLNIHKGRAGQLHPTVKVGNTSPEIISYLLSVSGGIGFKGASRREGKKWKAVAYWAIENCEGISFLLSKILKHLKGKKERAQLLIEFCCKRSAGKRIPYDERDREIYRSLRKLNKRGPVKSG